MAFIYPRLMLRKHTYYIRVQVPKSLIDIVKKKNIIYSLNTKNYQEALYRVREESYRVDLYLKHCERTKMFVENGKKIFFNDDDYKHFLVSRWVFLLRELEKNEAKIKKGIVGYKDLSFYQPAQLDDADRVEVVDTYDKDGNPIQIYKEVVDVWDGYKIREPNSDVAYNPSENHMEYQLFQFILQEIQKMKNEGRIDSDVVDILEDGGKLPFFRNKTDSISELDDFSSNFIGWHNLSDKMRESEKLLYDKIENIKNKTPVEISIYFENILAIAREVIKNSSMNRRIEPKLPNYEKLLQKWYDYQLAKGSSVKDSKNHIYKINIIISLLNNKKIKDITKKDMRNIEQQLLLLPKNASAKYPNKKFSDIIEKTKNNKNIPKIKPITVRDYISMFSSFLNFLVDEEILLSNPIRDYKFKYAIGKKEAYEPFTDDELALIFNPKTFPEYVVKNDTSKYPERFWILCLIIFLGCREDELCQLDVADIQCFSGVDCIIIQPSADKDKKTKTKQKRILPIPQKILDIGFLDYVNNRKKDNCKKLFNLKHNPHNGYAQEFGRWFASYLDKIGITSEQKVFHSFRHLMKMNYRNNDISDSAIKIIGGWSDNNGDGFSCYAQGAMDIVKLKKIVDSVDFPMIDFETLKNRTVEDIDPAFRSRRRPRKSILGK